MLKKLLCGALLTFAFAGSLQAEEVDVDAVKKKYWARGDESELGVVQNRLYKKEGKFEFSLIGGLVSTDPFLSVKALGASAGYHFNEYFALNLMGWKNFASSSSALETFERVSLATANTNKPESYFGAELAASLIYGKLSLLGAKIVYYDLHFLGGVGVTDTESGNSITPSVGLGQAIWVSQQLALRIDYRVMPYREDIIEKVRPSLLGQVVDSRTTWANVITLGATFMFGGGEQ